MMHGQKNIKLFKNEFSRFLSQCTDIMARNLVL